MCTRWCVAFIITHLQGIRLGGEWGRRSVRSVHLSGLGGSVSSPSCGTTTTGAGHGRNGKRKGKQTKSAASCPPPLRATPPDVKSALLLILIYSFVFVRMYTIACPPLQCEPAPKTFTSCRMSNDRWIMSARNHARATITMCIRVYVWKFVCVCVCVMGVHVCECVRACVYI